MHQNLRFCFLILLLCLPLNACTSSKDRSNDYFDVQKYNAYTAQQARKKNFSTIRTDMALKGLTLGAPVFIRAFKTEMELEVWVKRTYRDGYRLYKTYPICQKSGELGPKLAEGDLQTPEGFYNVTYDRLNPNSKYHLALNIGYPNTYDRDHGRTGSALMIHGSCVSEGCLAMTDQNIEDIYIIAEESLKHGQREVPVHLFPFRMTDENMLARNTNPWTPFWYNLKQGYDYFETYHIPPKISVMNQQYAFNAGAAYY